MGKSPIFLPYYLRAFESKNKAVQVVNEILKEYFLVALWLRQELQLQNNDVFAKAERHECENEGKRTRALVV